MSYYKTAMKIQNFILPAIGLLFAGLGALVVWYFAPMFNQAAGQVEQMSPLTAATVAASPAGQEGLIEGRVSESNPVQFRLFVAYVRYEYRGQDNDNDNESKWVEDERVTPALLLDLPGGRVQLANSDYGLDGRLVKWQSEPTLTWNSWSGEGTKSYEGLERGNPVLAIGTVVEGAKGREFNAEWLYGGTRATYLDDQRTSAQITRWVGLVFLVVGGVIFGLGVWVWLR
ncbi:MAG: hypothetical protein HC875_26290 [Anaerolineales bacterium]|nr:hypothetical protein [Anaerolineales bacterium]